MIRLITLCFVLGFATSVQAADGVHIEIFDRGLPSDKWPTELPAVSEEYDETAFGFIHVPWQYTSTGVRADRGNPYLMRATSAVTLPAGKYRLLLRARSAARLSVDGKRVTELSYQRWYKGDLTPPRHDALLLGLTRFVAPGDQEKLIEVTATGKPQQFVLELIVGGMRGKEPLRPELGETLVAIAPLGSTHFRLLAPGRSIQLTDEGWESYITERTAVHEAIEAEGRKLAFASHEPYWQERRTFAAAFVKANPAPVVPAPRRMLPANNAIDHFLNAKLEPAFLQAKANPTGAQFHRDVMPILAAKCLSCHGSNKPRGDLQLDDRTSTLTSIAPGKPEASELLHRVKATDPDEAMPPKGERLTAREIALLDRWIREGAHWPDEPPLSVSRVAPLTTDEEFLRRVSLDLLGTVPTVAEARAFLADRDPLKRTKLIDALLADKRWADAWVPYWQDVLAENPNIVNPTLNNTGPFRWWIYDVFRDDKPWDVAVTELVMMEGSRLGGGPAGFGMAALNDSPMAAKAGILASAFLATEMKCARCHDAPYHPVTQADLFHLAAMLDRKTVVVPASSTVPVGKLSRKPLVNITLKAGAKLDPRWTLPKLLASDRVPPLPAGEENDSRARLAALMTSPENERFAEVMVNRIWRRYMGHGLVEPPHDWDRARASHPELLKWLAREFVASGFSIKHITRLVLNSHAYQRQASPDRDAFRLFAAPAKRRLGPELLCDSLHDAFGKKYDTDLISFDLDGIRPWLQGGNYGVPRRAWQFPYLSNDRDRSTLTLPKAQAVTDLLTAFGWDGNRQSPVSDRTAEPSLLQPALLANGDAARRLTRLSDDSALLALCLDATSPESLVESLFLHTLTRQPRAEERAAFVALLAPGFKSRHAMGPFAPTPPRPTQPYASWAHHHSDEAVLIKQREAEAVRTGPAPTNRLTTDWRERAEDALWALLNSPELVFFP